jgi:uncharacterized protein YecT (DUF1311 family)
MWLFPARFAMPLGGALIGVLLMVPATMAQTEQKTALEDSATIQSCIAAAEKSEKKPFRECFGKVADPCLEKPENASTAAQSECIDRERAVWDAILNAEYAALLKMVVAPAKPKLREAQRSWVKFREQDCVLAYHFFEGGTMSQPMVRNCHAQETARRAMDLRSWRQTLGPN